MKKNQNNIILAVIAVVLVLMVIGVYNYYFVLPNKVRVNKPTLIPCAVGDRYNMITGDLCPGMSPATTTGLVN